MRVSRVIEAEREVVWDLLIDTQAWPRWGPSVREVRCAQRYITRSSRGRIVTAIGLALPFEITAFLEGQSWSWRVAGVGATGHHVDPLGPGRCRLSFELPALAAPYGAVCRVACARLAALAEGARPSSTIAS